MLARGQYLGLYKPVFERRRAILNGEAEPTADELKAGHELTLKDDPEAEPLPEKEEGDAEAKDTKGIPQFWLTALRNHMDISEMITERDEEVWTTFHFKFGYQSKLKLVYWENSRLSNR